LHYDRSLPDDVFAVFNPTTQLFHWSRYLDEWIAIVFLMKTVRAIHGKRGGINENLKAKGFQT